MNDAANAAVAAKVQAVMGSAPVRWVSLANRGYSHAGRWRAGLADGRTVFVKAAVDNLTAAWLRAEKRVFTTLRAPFLPQFLGSGDDDSLPVLVLEDLSAAYWPPPWTTTAIDAVRGLLHAVAATPPPPGLGRLSDARAKLEGWGTVEADPEPLLQLGLCSSQWLARCLPTLRAAADAAPLDGDALVHFDVRSDNLCIHGEQPVLLDWNGAAIGNPLFDLVSWLPSLQAEGGPAPEELNDQGTDELVALVAGYFAARAGLPVIPHAPRVRSVQLLQLRVALPWAARTLGLPTP
jgi:hypothetical protein